MTLSRVCFIVENATDVRMINGMGERFQLTVLGRSASAKSVINHDPEVPVAVINGPSARFAFARFVRQYLHSHRKDFDYIIVQGYSIAALYANWHCYFAHLPISMLICSPSEAYYRCRKQNSSKPFRWHEYFLMLVVARINAIIGQHYIVLSKHLEDVVHHHGGEKPVSIIPIYGVDTNIFIPTHHTKSAIRDNLGLPPSGSLIFFSSRLAPEKDSDTLLLALKELIDEGRDIWLLNRSGGYQEMEKAAEKLGIGERVIATDASHPHKDLPLSYQASDLCVQASREEGLGFSPLEALACGIPVIATKVGGLTETIIDGETGWTYPVGDSIALALCIKQVLDSPDEAEYRASKGREMVVANYDKELIFDQLLTLISAKTP